MFGSFMKLAAAAFVIGASSLIAGAAVGAAFEAVREIAGRAGALVEVAAKKAA